MVLVGITVLFSQIGRTLTAKIENAAFAALLNSSFNVFVAHLAQFLIFQVCTGGEI